MEKVQPYLNSEYGTLLAVALVVLALTLRAMGILALSVAFWSGFATCLGIQAYLVWYFLAKAEAKTEAKLDAYVRTARSFPCLVSLLSLPISPSLSLSLTASPLQVFPFLALYTP